jgi:hypothetical protein
MRREHLLDQVLGRTTQRFGEAMCVCVCVCVCLSECLFFFEPSFVSGNAFVLTLQLTRISALKPS